ncbi:MAG: peptidoglycan DD-metalloendopeptidase family protein [Actinomycetota bacterium]
MPSKRPPIRFSASALLALALTVLMALPSLAAGEAEQLEETKQQIAQIKKKLAAAKGEAAAIETEVDKLDNQISDLNRQIETGQADISSLESDIRSAQAQIDELSEQYQEAANASNERARRIYVQGPAEAVAMMFSATSLPEWNRLQFWLEKSSQADSQVMVDAARLKRDLEVRQDELNTIKTDLDEQRSWLQQRMKLADSARRERQAALATVEGEISVAQQHIDGLEADSARLEAALRASSAASNSSDDTAAPSSSGWVRPVNGRVTSGFGRRWGRAHTGVDLDGNTGDPIRAAKDGAVLGVSCGGGYGRCTIVDHGGGVTTLYAHMTRKAVSSGSVKAGEVIGYVGCTGSCTGSHLHFEVRINGTPRNPMNYI